MLALLADAIQDLLRGLRLRRVWIALAAEDIGDQHKRTTLGPLWLLINYLLFAGTFIFLFGPGTADPTFAVYVAVGLLVWFYLMEAIGSATSLFLREESFIQGTTLPLSVYVFRLLLQCLIRDGYALVGCVGILIVAGVTVTPAWLWSAFGILIIVAATPAVIIVVAFLGVFFPDSQFIVSNLMRVGMFMTPVFWSGAGETGLRGALYYYNPFTYFLDMVRQPIVDGTVPLDALFLCLGIGAAMWALALVLLGACRRQVALVL